MRLTQFAHDWLASRIPTGSIAIDATAGNGHDTLALARLVGPSGQVFAFDIQAEALAATRQRLDEHGYHWVELLQRSHAELNDWIPQQHFGRIAAIVYNLGYLPGGEHGVITTAETTLAALRQSTAWLAEGGALSVLAYRGHDGGRNETEAVARFFDELKSKRWEIEVHPGPSDAAPILFIGTKPHRAASE